MRRDYPQSETFSEVNACRLPKADLCNWVRDRYPKLHYIPAWWLSSRDARMTSGRARNELLACVRALRVACKGGGVATKNLLELALGGSGCPRLNRVIRFVHDHYADHLNLAVAARVAGLEKTYFSRYFKQHTGMTFKRWLSDLRIQRAIELMSTDLTITTIAHDVGFGDLRTFERAFRRFTGLCPRVFRQQIGDQRSQSKSPATTNESQILPSHLGRRLLS